MTGVGRPNPRLATEPLRELTEATSDGFALIAFAEQIGQPLLPWQEQAAIRALELREDGGYRFRTVLILVGRQSGKTTLLKTWALWRMMTEPGCVVIGTAQQLKTARESWTGVAEYAEDHGLAGGKRGGVRRANGEQEVKLANGSRYLISATSRGAGRGFSVDLLVMDELREQRTEEAWAALTPTILARPKGQVVCITNMGDDQSVVLNTQRARALGGEDERAGIFEWSAPEGCDLLDPDMLAQSVPGLGHVIRWDDLQTAVRSCTPQFARTEYLCQHVSSLDPAISAAGWALGADPQGSVAAHRARLSACVDVSADGNHVALVVATTLPDGRVRVEPVASWTATLEARRELPTLLGELAPLEVAWFPGGPANALAPVLAALPNARALTGTDVSAACMGFADLVKAGMIVHNANPLLDGQIATAGKQGQGDGFRFTRKGAGNCNALYAAAGATLSARTVKPRRAKVFVA